MKLKKQFEDFYKEITIDTEVEDLKEKRETLQSNITDRLPDEFDAYGIELKKSEIDIFDQGSYKLHTTIKDCYGGSIDRDVAVMFPLDIEKNSDTRKIKKIVRDILKVGNRNVSIKEPCINVSYLEKDEEWMHIDLPIYAVHNNSVFLSRGKELATEGNYSWEEADPKGLNDWLLGYINGNQQLRRMIRFLKKWKLKEYHNCTIENKVPPSIGLTILACEEFVTYKDKEEDDDLSALMYLLENIISRFSVVENHGEVIKAEINTYLPVVPKTDVFRKMNEGSDTHCISFYKKLVKALNNVKDAYNLESEHDAALCLQKVFGDEFVVPEKKAMSANVRMHKEHGFG